MLASSNRLYGPPSSNYTDVSRERPHDG